MGDKENYLEALKKQFPEIWQKHPAVMMRFVDDEMAKQEANIDLDKRIAEAITKAKQKYLEEAGETAHLHLARNREFDFGQMSRSLAGRGRRGGR
jgi:hypothetical protein